MDRHKRFSSIVKTIRVLTWAIRVIATIEAVDALVYLGDAGWFAAHPAVTLLVTGGVVGAALTWVRSPVAVMCLGGLLVAIAPSIVYPLSALLVVASLVIIALTRVRLRAGESELTDNARLA